MMDPPSTHCRPWGPLTRRSNGLAEGLQEVEATRQEVWANVEVAGVSLTRPEAQSHDLVDTSGSRWKAGECPPPPSGVAERLARGAAM